LVDSGDHQFHLYQRGILNTETCGRELTHAVIAVGYGVENGMSYFIVRNTFGPLWGEDGYIRMSADVGGNGVCGMLLSSTRPLVRPYTPTPGP
jgi:C1A family cysteine protease